MTHGVLTVTGVFPLLTREYSATVAPPGAVLIRANWARTLGLRSALVCCRGSQTIIVTSKISNRAASSSPMRSFFIGGNERGQARRANGVRPVTEALSRRRLHRFC
jgi:hypothetical protein